MLNRPFKFNTSYNNNTHTPRCANNVNRHQTIQRDGKYQVSLQIHALNGKIVQRNFPFGKEVAKYSGYVVVNTNGSKVKYRQLSYYHKTEGWVPLKTKDIGNGRHEFTVNMRDIPDNKLRVNFECKFVISGRITQFKPISCTVEKYI